MNIFHLIMYMGIGDLLFHLDSNYFLLFLLVYIVQILFLCNDLRLLLKHIVYLIDMNVPNMKTNDSKEKQFRQLSDEELEKVNGGGVSLDIDKVR